MPSIFTPEEVDIFVTELAARVEKANGKLDLGGSFSTAGAVMTSKAPVEGPFDVAVKPPSNPLKKKCPHRLLLLKATLKDVVDEATKV